jgi:hypothetical protein
MLEIIIENWYAIITSSITLASVITTSTNTPKDEGVVKSIYGVIEIIALAKGKTKQ